MHEKMVSVEAQGHARTIPPTPQLPANGRSWMFGDMLLTYDVSCFLGGFALGRAIGACCFRKYSQME